MAYAALNSLSQIIEQTLNNYDQFPFSFKKENLVSLQENVSTLLTFLDNHSSHEGVNCLEGRIIDMAYQAEDIIESEVTPLCLSSSEERGSTHELFYCCLCFNFKKFLFRLSISNNQCGLDRVLREIHIILTDMMAMKNDSSTKNDLPKLDSSSSASTSELNTLGDTNTLVGFDGENPNDDFMVIKKRMYLKSSDLQVIPIVGMGGIGKSTLARKMYEDSIRAQHFDICAWITVSQEYSRGKMLSGILLSLNKLTGEDNQKSDAELVEFVYKELYGRRFLIVVDDVWSTKAWDDLKVIFPKEKKGSRVLVTSRLSNVAIYVGTASSPPFEMHFLCEDQMWSLIKETVFGKGSCPSQLEHIGKKIAQNCEGLPLTAAVVAGLLKRNITAKFWETVSKNISSTEPTIALQCSKVLCLSYDLLPLYLQPCFLYVSAFPGHKEIKVSRLIKLWVAEGFVKPTVSKCVEEVAEAYLDDLVKRSLLIVSQRRYNGRTKAVRMHDLLRDIGTSISRDQRFHNHDILGSMDVVNRRLSVHLHNSLGRLEEICHETTRSLLIFSSDIWYNPYTSESFPIPNLWLLRILDAPDEVIVHPEKLVHLRYLAFEFTNPNLPKSVSLLRNLQTLIIKGYFIKSIPLEVWKSPSLRHLIIVLRTKCILEQPSEHEIVEATNLQTLSVVKNLEITTQTIKMLANLRKLGVQLGSWENFKLRNLVHLETLEELKIQGLNPGVLSGELAFPPNLKKLSLDNIECVWDDINMAGSLKSLEVLKLRGFVTTDMEWNPVDDQFPALRYLKLDGVPLDFWGADSTHFPSLEILVFKDIKSHKLKIPDAIGEIVTLKSIELYECCSSLNESAKQIQADQKEMGNGGLQLIVFQRSLEENIRILILASKMAFRFMDGASSNA